LFVKEEPRRRALHFNMEKKKNPQRCKNPEIFITLNEMYKRKKRRKSGREENKNLNERMHMKGFPNCD